MQANEVMQWAATWIVLPLVIVSLVQVVVALGFLLAEEMENWKDARRRRLGKRKVYWCLQENRRDEL